jgi:hypothetical protein
MAEKERAVAWSFWSISLDSLTKQLTVSICNRRRREASCHLLVTERDTGFFCAAMKALVPRWDKCSNISSDYFEI